MNKFHLLGVISACAVSLITFPSYAALIGVLPATPGGTDYQAYYDDVADLTWLADANAAGPKKWCDANAWAAGVDVDGVTGWRLPSSLNSDNTGPCGPAYNCSDSEMGNLYYNVLGNVSGSGGFTNTGPFSNVQSFIYWSSSEYAPNPSFAWYFSMSNGRQGSLSKVNGFYAWAVQSGNVGAVVVPVPAAAWLFASGLLGLMGVARRKKTA